MNMARILSDIESNPFVRFAASGKSFLTVLLGRVRHLTENRFSFSRRGDQPPALVHVIANYAINMPTFAVASD
jgi:hypothetical protein